MLVFDNEFRTTKPMSNDSVTLAKIAYSLQILIIKMNCFEHERSLDNRFDLIAFALAMTQDRGCRNNETTSMDDRVFS